MEHTRFAQANEKATYTFFFFFNFEAKLLLMLFKEDKSLAIRFISVGQGLVSFIPWLLEEDRSLSSSSKNISL